MKATQVPVNRWLTQESVPHPHTNTWEYYSAIKNDEVLPFATWVDLENIILSETRKTEKDEYSMISLIHASAQLLSHI